MENKHNGPAGNTLRRLPPSVKAFKEDVVRTHRRPVERFHDPFGAVEAASPEESPVPAFVRARSCVTPQLLKYRWVVLTRDELKGTNKRGDLWEDCYIFHNGDLALDDFMTSMVVCDGDVTFLGRGDTLAARY